MGLHWTGRPRIRAARRDGGFSGTAERLGTAGLVLTILASTASLSPDIGETVRAKEKKLVCDALSIAQLTRSCGDPGQVEAQVPVLEPPVIEPLPGGPRLPGLPGLPGLSGTRRIKPPEEPLRKIGLLTQDLEDDLEDRKPFKPYVRGVYDEDNDVNRDLFYPRGDDDKEECARHRETWNLRIAPELQAVLLRWATRTLATVRAAAGFAGVPTRLFDAVEQRLERLRNAMRRPVYTIEMVKTWCWDTRSGVLTQWPNALYRGTPDSTLRAWIDVSPQPLTRGQVDETDLLVNPTATRSVGETHLKVKVDFGRAVRSLIEAAWRGAGLPAVPPATLLNRFKYVYEPNEVFDAAIQITGYTQGAREVVKTEDGSINP